MPQDRKHTYTGVNFDTVRTFLFNMYFYYPEMTEEEVQAAMKYVVPMQHNFENPLQGDEAKDTFIEYFIARDERITQDFTSRGNGSGADTAYKLATIDLRFVGVEAEVWAKAFHHITKRPNVAILVGNLMAGKILEHVGDIIPVNIDYFGVGNSSIAFDLSIKIEYNESILLNWKSLKYISLGDGEMITSGLAED